MPSQLPVSRAVRQYIDGRPTVRDALTMGIANLSAVARRIMDDLDLDQEAAVVAACRRYVNSAPGSGHEAAIRDLLDHSRLQVATHIAVLTVRKDWRLLSRLETAMRDRSGSDPVHVIRGSEAVTVLLDEAHVDALVEHLGAAEVLSLRKGLVEITICSPSTVEAVPGVLAFLASSLSSRGINLIEAISCHKDNIFIIDEPDLFQAYEVLSALMKT